jgi:hypothetical protein
MLAKNTKNGGVLWGGVAISSCFLPSKKKKYRVVNIACSNKDFLLSLGQDN